MTVTSCDHALPEEPEVLRRHDEDVVHELLGRERRERARERLDDDPRDAAPLEAAGLPVWGPAELVSQITGAVVARHAAALLVTSPLIEAAGWAAARGEDRRRPRGPGARGASAAMSCQLSAVAAALPATSSWLARR